MPNQDEYEEATMEALRERCRRRRARRAPGGPDGWLYDNTYQYVERPSLYCTNVLLITEMQDDANLIDNSETVYISSLALLKMLRHGRAGVPMEVMGLMLGEFVDDFTVRVVDVFAMPQSGTGVSVEAVDPVFQTKMMDMLRQTGR